MLWILCMMDDVDDEEYSKRLYFDDAEDALEKAFNISMTGYVWEQCGKPDYMELIGIYDNQLLDYLNDEDTAEKAYARWENMKQTASKRNEVAVNISPSILDKALYSSTTKEVRDKIIS